MCICVHKTEFNYFKSKNFSENLANVTAPSWCCQAWFLIFGEIFLYCSSNSTRADKQENKRATATWQGNGGIRPDQKELITPFLLSSYYVVYHSFPLSVMPPPPSSLCRSRRQRRRDHAALPLHPLLSSAADGDDAASARMTPPLRLYHYIPLHFVRPPAKLCNSLSQTPFDKRRRAQQSRSKLQRKHDQRR